MIQKKILLFVSGYRNYAGQMLLHNTLDTLTGMKKPGGNAVLSSFPKIVDNIDILEKLVEVWSEDVMTTNQKKTITYLMTKSADIIERIYPVLFADEF